MEREAVRQSQSEHREPSNGSQPSASDSAPTPSSAPAPVTPTPPRLTPNPLLLDCPAPLPPSTCSPPPPLTPAPSLSTSHITKTATPTSPHLLVPAPPKLTSTTTPTLRTYARPILPSPAKTQTAATSSPASNTTSSSTASLSTKTSTTLTNGSSRMVATTTSTPITPFHTPASPPGRQVSQALPVGTTGLVRANQSAAPVRQRVSQQTLLLGKGLKGSGPDQVLLRAQMLQSLTLRPPPPGALTIPPSLRLKPPTSSSAPPPLSRPQAPLFPPLRPRPVTTAATDSTPATPSRHLSVPPPTLYSPVRAVPLRPRLLSPNGHRAAPPRQSHPNAASAPSSVNRPISGLKTCSLSQSILGQSPASPFERSPSAARQLQIIALSSGRQFQTSANASAQKTAVDSETSCQKVLPLSPTFPKTSSPLPSPTAHKGEVKDTEKLKQACSEEGTVAKDLKVETDDQREHEKLKAVTVKEDKTETAKARQEDKDDKEAMDITEEGQSGKKVEREKKMADEEMEVTDQSESRKGPNQNQNSKDDKDSNNETKPRISAPVSLASPVKSSPLPVQNPNPDPIPVPIPLTVSVRPQITLPASVSTPVPATVAVQTPSPVPLTVPVTAPVSVPVSVPISVPVSVPVQEVTPNQSQRFADLHSTNQDDFCENMSIQSDNQSALSSLSSQSPPSSPFVSPSADAPLPPPPPPPGQPDRPTDLSLMHKQDQTPNDSQNHEADAEPLEPLVQSEDETEGFDQSESGHWEPRAWPEGQQVLTHLVEGFVIQEGLMPFPVNRSSLLVPEQVAKPQEVNGTNGSAALPVTPETPKTPETKKPTEHSTDSEEEEGGDTEDHSSRPSHRDRAVLHCQFCGKRGHAHNFMRSKRFCSTSCARGFNVRLTKRLRALSAGSRSERPRPTLNRAESVPGKPLLLRLPRDLWSAGRREKEVKEKPPVAAEDDDEEEMELEAGADEDDDDDGPEEEEEEEEEELAAAAMTTTNTNAATVTMTATTENRVQHRPRRASAPAVTTTTPTTTFKPAPSQWSVEEVTAFINTLPGCGDVAEAFRVQEIDGQALLLLTEDHLMTSMNIKLGPALKICAHINALKNP